MFILSSLFLLLAIITMWIIIGARGNSIFKGMLILVTVTFPMWFIYEAVNQRGWATEQQVPEKFYVESFKIHEPHSICILVDDFYDDTDELRYYRIPYSKELHRNAEHGKRLLQNKKRVVGTRKGIESMLQGKSGSGEGEGSEKGKGNNKGKLGKHKRGMRGMADGDGAFYQLPPPVYPDKE